MAQDCCANTRRRGAVLAAAVLGGAGCYTATTETIRPEALARAPQAARSRPPADDARPVEIGEGSALRFQRADGSFSGWVAARQPRPLDGGEDAAGRELSARLARDLMCHGLHSGRLTFSLRRALDLRPEVVVVISDRLGTVGDRLLRHGAESQPEQHLPWAHGTFLVVYGRAFACPK